MQLKYGFRYSRFGLTGDRTKYTFGPQSDIPLDSSFTSGTELQGRLEPRVSIHYAKGKNTIALSYDRTVQFLHLLANSSVGLPTDIWWPSTHNVKPQAANIFATSYSREISKSLQFTLATFYKSLINVVDFKDNARLFVNKHVESQLLQGKGTAYGAEAFVTTRIGKINGSASYTYSKAFNEIEGVNGGDPYPNRYDKRHNLSMLISYPVSDRVAINSNFVLTTGGALTVPDGSFVFDGIAFNAYGARGNYRMPVYHRLDVSLKYENRKNNELRNVKRYWLLDVYNLYSKKNPFTLYSTQEDSGFYRTNTNALYLFRTVPTLSYNFQF
jgi:hypothetical protein